MNTNLEPQIASIQKLFRKLRGEWFRKVLQYHPPEREWESEEIEAARNHSNKQMKKLFDKQTQAMLDGDKTVYLAPRCANDLHQNIGNVKNDD